MIAMRPESLAARLWPDRTPRLEPLGGGITNHNFKVSLDGEAFVLRIGGKDTNLLGIDRRAEHAAACAAAAAGSGPEVVAFLEPEGALVTRFVEGRPLSLEEMRSPDAIARAVAALKPFHDGDSIPARFDPFAVVETYVADAAARGAQVPPGYVRARELAGRIQSARGPQPLRPCHNDLLNANFILGEGRLWIVDWEYAGMGDVFFDLANFSANHDFGAEEDDELLGRYFGERTRADAAALVLMRFMSDLREATWGLVQQGISELDFDFAEYTRRHFDRLECTAAAPRFRAALHTLEQA
jgi:thiamine kinase-like enzyme